MAAAANGDYNRSYQPASLCALTGRTIAANPGGTGFTAAVRENGVTEPCKDIVAEMAQENLVVGWFRGASGANDREEPHFLHHGMRHLASYLGSVPCDLRRDIRFELALQVFLGNEQWVSELLQRLNPRRLEIDAKDKHTWTTEERKLISLDTQVVKAAIAGADTKVLDERAANRVSDWVQGTGFFSGLFCDLGRPTMSAGVLINESHAVMLNAICLGRIKVLEALIQHMNKSAAYHDYLQIGLLEAIRNVDEKRALLNPDLYPVVVDMLLKATAKEPQLPRLAGNLNPVLVAVVDKKNVRILEMLLQFCNTSQSQSPWVYPQTIEMVLLDAVRRNDEEVVEVLLRYPKLGLTPEGFTRAWQAATGRPETQLPVDDDWAASAASADSAAGPAVQPVCGAMVHLFTAQHLSSFWTLESVKEGFLQVMLTGNVGAMASFFQLASTLHLEQGALQKTINEVITYAVGKRGSKEMVEFMLRRHPEGSSVPYPEGAAIDQTLFDAVNSYQQERSVVEPLFARRPEGSEAPVLSQAGVDKALMVAVGLEFKYLTDLEPQRVQNVELLVKLLLEPHAEGGAPFPSQATIDAACEIALSSNKWIIAAALIKLLIKHYSPASKDSFQERLEKLCIQAAPAEAASAATAAALPPAAAIQAAPAATSDLAAATPASEPNVVQQWKAAWSARNILKMLCLLPSLILAGLRALKSSFNHK